MYMETKNTNTIYGGKTMNINKYMESLISNLESKGFYLLANCISTGYSVSIINDEYCYCSDNGEPILIGQVGTEDRETNEYLINLIK